MVVHSVVNVREQFEDGRLRGIERGQEHRFAVAVHLFRKDPISQDLSCLLPGFRERVDAFALFPTGDVALSDGHLPVFLHPLERSWDVLSLYMNRCRDACLREYGGRLPSTAGELLVNEMEEGSLLGR